MDYQSIYQSWLNNPGLNEEGKAELMSVAADAKAIEYRFGAELEFGTAGMRGIIGYGTNMMNVYTVRRATQGLAEYIKSLGEDAMKRGVVISFDTRRKSDEFARAAAEVLAANGVNVYLFDDVHPVPMLSYAVRAHALVRGAPPRHHRGHHDHRQPQPQGVQRVQGIRRRRRTDVARGDGRRRRLYRKDHRLLLRQGRKEQAHQARPRVRRQELL